MAHDCTICTVYTCTIHNIMDLWMCAEWNDHVLGFGLHMHTYIYNTIYFPRIIMYNIISRRLAPLCTTCCMYVIHNCAFIHTLRVSEDMHRSHLYMFFWSTAHIFWGFLYWPTKTLINFNTQSPINITAIWLGIITFRRCFTLENNLNRIMNEWTKPKN